MPDPKKENQSKVQLKKIIDDKQLTKLDYHLFFCTGDSCNEHFGLDRNLHVWQKIKNKCQDFHKQTGIRVGRNKVQCLQICTEGPIAVCFPGGHYFHHFDDAAVDEFFENIKNLSKISSQFHQSMQ